MAYFLKKTTLKGRTYLSICESFYKASKKGTAHKTYKSLGSVETCKENGIKDPISHFQQVVDSLNAERNDKGTPKISDVSPNRFLGYFPLKAIMEKLRIKHYVDYFKITNDFNFDLYELLSSLVYAGAVNPCSKYRTFHEVLPNLLENVSYSYDQLLDGLSFIGNEYEKFIEIFNVQVSKKYGLYTTKSYFDCTNFYFEIDRENDLQKRDQVKKIKKNLS